MKFDRINIQADHPFEEREDGGEAKDRLAEEIGSDTTSAAHDADDLANVEAAEVVR